MEKITNSLNTSMNYGAVVGILLIAVSLLFYLMDMYDSSAAGWVSYAVIFIALYFVGKQNRDQNNGGYISYSQNLKFSTTVMIFVGIIVGFYTYIFLLFIDASIIELAVDQALEDLEERGMSDEEIEQSMSYVEMFTNPGMMAMFTFFGYILVGFIFSAITSMFIKRDHPSGIN